MLHRYSCGSLVMPVARPVRYWGTGQRRGRWFDLPPRAQRTRRRSALLCVFRGTQPAEPVNSHKKTQDRFCPATFVRFASCCGDATSAPATIGSAAVKLPHSRASLCGYPQASQQFAATTNPRSNPIGNATFLHKHRTVYHKKKGIAAAAPQCYDTFTILVSF